MVLFCFVSVSPLYVRFDVPVLNNAQYMPDLFKKKVLATALDQTEKETKGTYHNIHEIRHVRF